MWRVKLSRSNPYQADVVPDVTSQVTSEEKIPASRIAAGIPNFIKVLDYTTFSAEYAMKDGDLVVHFYPTDVTKGIWTREFAWILDRVAQDHFRATAPRLQAKFTEEVNSWWLRARGYSHIVNIKAFVDKFFELIDQALEADALQGSTRGQASQ